MVRRWASRSLCFSAIVMALFFDSCAPDFQYSVYALHTSQDILRDETLTGHWRMGDTEEMFWHIVLTEDGTYEFRLGDYGTYYGHLVRVGGERFFDFLEADSHNKDMHFFCKLNADTDTFTLSCVNRNVLDSENAEAITLQDVLITSPDELQGLLSRHINDASAYEKPFVFVRISETDAAAYEDAQKKEAQAFAERFGSDLGSALLGDEVAQEALGRSYAAGHGAKDWKRARYWFWRAACQGRASAQLALAQSYETFASERRPEYRAAFFWYHKAAMAGNADAQLRLGEFYSRTGTYIPDDQLPFAPSDSLAVAWLQKAAAQNHPKALSDLAWRYSYGSGISQDEPEAIRLYKQYLELKPDDHDAWEELINIYQLSDDATVRDPAAALAAANLYQQAQPDAFARWASKHSLFGEVQPLQKPQQQELPYLPEKYLNFTFDQPPAPGSEP